MAPPPASPPPDAREDAALDVAALARRFEAVFPHLAPASGAVAVTLYRLLAQGEPVPWTRLAEATGRPVDALRALVGGWPGVYEEPAGLTGFGGLSVRPVSPHAVRVDGRTLHTRCAWDTLFLPAVLERRLEVASRCAVTGAPVTLTVSPAGLQRVEPPGARLSLRPPEPAMLADLTQHF